MNKKVDFTQDNTRVQNAVTERGYAIYNEWKENRCTSRRVVKCVKRAKSAMKRNPSVETRTEAMAYLFALDLRAKNEYKSILRCLVSYPSWRRETGALKGLKADLLLSERVDVPTAIEQELQKMGKAPQKEGDAVIKRERLEAIPEITEKKDAPAGNRIYESGQKDLYFQPEVMKKSAEQTSGKEEAEDLSVVETVFGERSAKEEGTAVREHAIVNLEDVERPRKSIPHEKKTENNGLEKSSESIDHKNKESAGYDPVVDFPPLPDSLTKKKKPAEKISFIDEVIMDNMVKGESDIVWHNPLQDVKENGTENANRTAISIPEESVNGPSQKAKAKKAQGNGATRGKAEAQKTEAGNGARVPLRVDLQKEGEAAKRKGAKGGPSKKTKAAKKENALKNGGKERVNVSDPLLKTNAPDVGKRERPNAEKIKKEPEKVQKINRTGGHD